MVTVASTVARMTFIASPSWDYNTADDQDITAYPLEPCRWQQVPQLSLESSLLPRTRGTTTQPTIRISRPALWSPVGGDGCLNCRSNDVYCLALVGLQHSRRSGYHGLPSGAL